jgi:charged multivesicular body protein 6
VQRDVVAGLEQGTRVLAEINAEMGGIDKVERLMGENAEAIAYQQVSALLCFSIILTPPPAPSY